MRRRVRTVCALALVVAAGCSSGPKALERGAEPVTGAWYRHNIYTHCGVYNTEFAGKTWYANPPLTDGQGNPPASWSGVPMSFRVLSETDAEARNRTGDVARFVSAPPPGVTQPAVCF